VHETRQLKNDRGEGPSLRSALTPGKAEEAGWMANSCR
jgi:hypothetical protein